MKKNAWLITWEFATGEAAPVEERVIAILDPRLSARNVRNFIEQFYMAHNYSLPEKFDFSTRPKLNPYRAEFGQHPQGGYDRSVITCGHNPFILAKFVHNLRIVEGPDSSTRLHWEEPQKEK